MNAPDFLEADCEVCPACQSSQSSILYRRKILGIYERRHKCGACNDRWNSYQSLLDPRKVRVGQFEKRSCDNPRRV